MHRLTREPHRAHSPGAEAKGGGEEQHAGSAANQCARQRSLWTKDRGCLVGPGGLAMEKGHLSDSISRSACPRFQGLFRPESGSSSGAGGAPELRRSQRALPRDSTTCILVETLGQWGGHVRKSSGISCQDDANTLLALGDSSGRLLRTEGIHSLT